MGKHHHQLEQARIHSNKHVAVANLPIVWDLLYGGSLASHRHLATWSAYYIEFHTLLRHHLHADIPTITLV